MMERIRMIGDHWLDLIIGTAFWCVLWGGIAVTNVLGGILAIIIVLWFFPMPVGKRELTFRPLAFAWLILCFCFDVVKSSIEVSWYAIRPAPQPEGSIIAVPLESRSDLFLTITAAFITLIPGSVVVEAQRSTSTLFLHAFGAGTEEEVRKAKRAAFLQEQRVLRALAPRDVLREVKERTS